MKKAFLALTVKEINVSFEDDEVIPPETAIVVDVEREIGIWNNHHFDIYSDEYMLIS